MKCFYCDGGLRNWQPEDAPWVEHARWVLIHKCQLFTLFQVVFQVCLCSTCQGRWIYRQMPCWATTRKGTTSISEVLFFSFKILQVVTGGRQVTEEEVRRAMSQAIVRQVFLSLYFFPPVENILLSDRYFLASIFFHRWRTDYWKLLSKLELQMLSLPSCPGRSVIIWEWKG